MKRLVVLALVFVLMMGMSAAAFAEAAPLAIGIVEEAMDGARVRVTLDLTDNWSAEFYPMAFYLYSPDCSEEGEFDAYGVLMNEKSYTSLLESHAEDTCEERDGYIVIMSSNGETAYVAPVDEGLYVLLLVDQTVDADDAWARVACELKSYPEAGPVQTVSGVIADSMDESVQVRVKLDLSYDWSARFYPMAFYLCSPDCEGEEEFDAYGTLLSAQAYASVVEGHGEEAFTEKDGYLIYTTVDGQTGIIAQVDENEYITLIVPSPWDVDAMWARVSYELF